MSFHEDDLRMREFELVGVPATPFVRFEVAVVVVEAAVAVRWPGGVGSGLVRPVGEPIPGDKEAPPPGEGNGLRAADEDATDPSLAGAADAAGVG